MNFAPNHRLLLIDDYHSIHDDFRKVLCPAPAGDLDAAESLLLGEMEPAEERPAFEIHSAFQGEEGVALLRAALDAGRPYAVAFVDVRMPPGINGMETATRLCEMDADLQVVICTAHSDFSWQEMNARLGHSGRLLILKKPFDAMELLQLACVLTEKWRLAQQTRVQMETVSALVEARTTELHATNEQLRAELAHRELVEAQLLRRQRLESIGTLASGLAHNLNNMLSPILIGAPALLMDLPRETCEVIVRTIETSAQRAAEIVRQLMTFSCGAEGERSPLNVGDLLRGMKVIATEIFPKKIGISVTLPDGLEQIEADPSQLQQVLMNLCINARDAMPEGGSLTIEAANFEVDENYASMKPEAHAGSYVVIRVSDTGLGIRREVLDRIFDPFFTTKMLGQASGLGLSTVAGIVRGHGGFINVSSHIGQGTTFELFLPSLRTKCTPAASTPATDMLHGQGELVLVVDDECSIREILTTVLTENGYQTLAAADGTEALSLYATHGREIKAVLTDVLMPFLDGAALSRALCKIDPNVKIVVSTGEAGEGQFAQLRSLGVKNFLTKPYSTVRLLGALREAMAGQEAACAA